MNTGVRMQTTNFQRLEQADSPHKSRGDTAADEDTPENGEGAAR